MGKDSIYQNDPGSKPTFDKKQKDAYFDFFSAFRSHLADYLRLNHPTLMIWEMVVDNSPITLYKELDSCLRLVVKNQGDKPAFISTDLLSGYRLDMGEHIELTISKPISFIATEGRTKLGFIQN